MQTYETRSSLACITIISGTTNIPSKNFFAETAPYKTAKNSATKRSKNDPGAKASKLLTGLFSRHQFSSAYGSHADPKSFEHRLEKDKVTGYWTFTFVQTKNEHEKRIECLKIMEAFADLTELHICLHDGQQTVGKNLLLLQIGTLRSTLNDLAGEI
jgi:hypothetical protein